MLAPSTVQNGASLTVTNIVSPLSIDVPTPIWPSRYLAGIGETSSPTLVRSAVKKTGKRPTASVGKKTRTGR